MNRQDAEQIITEYLKPIFGFALKRCRNVQDAEDLSQDIVQKAFYALSHKEEDCDASKFIWTIAHNALSNYYRDTAKCRFGISIDQMAETLADPDSMVEAHDNADTICRLQREIAYLSKLQRKIVITYYFENRKQADIAKALGIPLGTVKWHLFEAKKELKRGMNTMRATSELKFNPIKFHSYGINGSVGSKNLDEFFRSTLSQNICYCVRNEAKTINEIADALGVSPVYVETEVDFLEKYGFLKEDKGAYIVNFIISEPSAQLLTLQDEMYKKAAGLYANGLYDALMASGLLDHGDFVCGPNERADYNFLLWALIPYITAESGENSTENKISFEEVATMRPDGAHNICHATIVPDNIVLPSDYVYMKNWCGPFRYPNTQYAVGNTSFWQLDTQWSERRINVSQLYGETADRILTLEKRDRVDADLSKDEYAWLSELGYRKSTWQLVTIGSKALKDKLLEIGEKVKAQYKDAFEQIKMPYVEMVLDSVPTHLRRVKEYELQFVFHSDGWFLLHCVNELLNNGKLVLPTEEQRKTLSTIIVQN